MSYLDVVSGLALVVCFWLVLVGWSIRSTQRRFARMVFVDDLRLDRLAEDLAWSRREIAYRDAMRLTFERSGAERLESLLGDACGSRRLEVVR